jgi:hypothetical protein
MAIILNQYAIKEVADVMFYELDSQGAPSAPVLYLDTLKTSTIEQSAETVDATGGKGNVKLLSWNTNKEINLTLEDAVFSAKSLAMMFGGSVATSKPGKQEVLKTLRKSEFKPSTSKLYVEIKDKKYYIDATKVLWYQYDSDNKVVLMNDQSSSPKIPVDEKSVPDGADFGTFDLLDASISEDTYSAAVIDGLTIDIKSEFDDRAYYITGDTYARNLDSGKDEFLQFIIPKGKISPEDVSLTMEADGDPATFSMTVNCLKSKDGSMIKLIKYDLNTGSTTKENQGVASVIEAYANNTLDHDDFVEGALTAADSRP